MYLLRLHHDGVVKLQDRMKVMCPLNREDAAHLRNPRNVGCLCCLLLRPLMVLQFEGKVLWRPTKHRYRQ